ncbi:hypothetical protein HK102_004046, partial [Quaeritorhiza haematococci]
MPRFLTPLLSSAAILALLCTPGADAYSVRPRDFTDQDFGTHEQMMVDAVDVLQRDGHHVEFELFNQFRAEMKNGQTAADHDGGNFNIPIVNKKVDKNSFSHFYNVATGEGLQPDAPGKSEVLVYMGFLGGYATMLIGPGMPATETCIWNYAKAVKHMREGRTSEAMKYISYATHFVQDVTVPQHVTDCSAEQNRCQHVEYEDYINKHYPEILSEPISGGRYFDFRSAAPHQIVHTAAAHVADQLSRSTSRDDATRRAVARELAPLAVQYSAGMLKRFFDSWQTEDFSVVMVRIDRIKARAGRSCEEKCVERGGFLWLRCRRREWRCERDRGSDIDRFTDPDFEPEVRIDDSAPKRRGHTTGIDDVVPSKSLDANAWTFAQWVPRSSGQVKIQIDVHDVITSWCLFRSCGNRETHVDLSGDPNTRSVEVWVDLAELRNGEKNFAWVGCHDNQPCHKAADISFS